MSCWSLLLQLNTNLELQEAYSNIISRLTNKSSVCFKKRKINSEMSIVVTENLNRVGI